MKEAERMLNNIFWLIWTIMLVCLIWQGLEVMFYGEAQPREVDDIITLIWIGIVVKAYYLGWAHGVEKAQEAEHNKKERWCTEDVRILPTEKPPIIHTEKPPKPR